MSIISELATTLGRKDEVPNQELATKIATKKNKDAVNELIENLKNKDKNIQSDCIKVLYEVGKRNPELIADHYKEFIVLLSNKNNRMIWGAMTVLDSITNARPKEIYDNLTTILEASDKGSVITKDHTISILIKLATMKQYADDSITLLFEQMKACPPNQFPMYAEYAFPVIPAKYKAEFIGLLQSRISDLEKESKQKRIEKIIKKLSK